ncbi:sirohydrochlorin chelatase [Vagococcus sp. BWB3-3]|uniref:Sirohydrochlorin chelatase n=1 Tax=Vagococcus allomyrinae TaxID=2794353 RepID=A0A940P7B2_9ENTE|nr:sirohydrochlorin chelatase [Vagococcus allomyrinae]MBP1042994.1 sirohydrochlorin chelatase [Vagococcus allomyrinae]
MRGIIYVAHGSQKTGKNQKMREFYNAIKAERSEEQALAFLEKHPDSLESVAKKMIQSGVTQLVVVPLLLFSAMHKKEDIPEQLAVVLQSFPEVDLRICETFAQEPEVTGVLLEAILQKQREKKLMAPVVFLVAHGSSFYSEPFERLRQIGEKLAQASELRVVTAGLYGQESYLEKAKSLLETTSDLLVVPFFLFDGHLVTKLEAQLRELAEASASQIYFSETLNLNRKMVPGILRLIEEELVDG